MDAMIQWQHLKSWSTYDYGQSTKLFLNNIKVYVPALVAVLNELYSYCVSEVKITDKICQLPEIKKNIFNYCCLNKKFTEKNANGEIIKKNKVHE